MLEFGYSKGASLIGVSGPESYNEYLNEVKTRLDETKATNEDYMVTEDALSFFKGLSEPGKVFTELRSIIILGVYAFDQESDYKSTPKELQGKIARTYSYYPVVRSISEQVVEYIKDAGYEAIEGQYVPLKYVAQKSGFGTYGWNSLLYTKDFGSYVALRCILTNADLPPDTFTPFDLSCDTCGRCVEDCPTGALYAPYKVNPKLCINPISRKEEDILPEIRGKMANWICGCDICQDVCPKNKRLEPRIPDPVKGFYPDKHASHRILGGLTGTPGLMDIIKGNKNSLISRNAIIALGNIGTKETMNELVKIKSGGDNGLGDYISYAIDQIKTRLTAGDH